MRLSDNGLATLREATLKDDTLKELIKVIHNGWPELKQDLQPSIRTYWPYRDELVADNNIIFKGTKAVVPKSMRTEKDTLESPRTRSMCKTSKGCHILAWYIWQVKSGT